MRTWKNFGLTSTLEATASPSTSLCLVKKCRYNKSFLNDKKKCIIYIINEVSLVWFSLVVGEQVGNDMHHWKWSSVLYCQRLLEDKEHSGFLCVFFLKHPQPFTSKNPLISPEECKRHVLRLNLSEVVVVGEVEGSSLTLFFSTTLNIQQAASSVFGQRKNTVRQHKANSPTHLRQIFFLD